MLSIKSAAPWHLAQQLAMLHCLGWAPYEPPLNNPAWSISAEVWVSIAFAALLTTRRRLFALAPIALVPLFVHVGDGHVEQIAIASLGVWRGLAGFSVGVLAYEAHSRIGEPPAWLAYALSLALAAFFVVPVDFQISHSSPLRTYAFYSVVFACLVTLSRRSTLFDTAPLVWLGKVSYSIYMWHVPIYLISSDLLGEAARGGWAKVAMIAATLLVSWPSQRWLEEPAQRWLLSLRWGRTDTPGIRA
jgi:peptidoglycan/LPS O-acetylase OafA/YrhL